jgi:hypothetical protein
MFMAGSDESTPEALGYEPPVLTILGSVEAITLSSHLGSFSDGHGRISKKP